MQPQYSQGAAPSHHPPPFAPPEVSHSNGGSTTSSLRQWRKKDYVEKQQSAERSSTTTNAENPSHVARVAPHTYYPRLNNGVCHYQYPEYGASFKPPAPATVKYSEIVDSPQSQPIEHIISPQPHLKQFQDQMSSLKQGFAENGKQTIIESTVHPQYLSKEPQLNQFMQKQSQMHQFIQKEPYQQYIPKYGVQGQYSQPYASEPNNFLAHLSKINPRMAQSIINDTHLRDSQISMFHTIDQNRTYPQQRIYQTQSVHSSPTQRNISQPYNYPQPYNYNIKSNIQPNDPYNRVHQFHNTPSKYLPSSIDQPIPNISPQCAYNDNMPLNYAPMPPKISPNYPHCGQLEYAQHYQHRRAPINQEYYPHLTYKSPYMQNPQISPEINGSDSRTRKSSLKQYLESWVDEDMSGNLPDIVISNNLNEIDGIESIKAAMCLKNSDTQDQPLYVLDTTEIPNENLPHFLHLQQFEKLPDNIRGYYHSANSIPASKRIIIGNEDLTCLPEVSQLIRSNSHSVESISSRSENNKENQAQSVIKESEPSVESNLENLEDKVVHIHIIENTETNRDDTLKSKVNNTVIIEPNVCQQNDKFTKIVEENQDCENGGVASEQEAAETDETKIIPAVEMPLTEVALNGEVYDGSLPSRRSSISSIYREIEDIHGDLINNNKDIYSSSKSDPVEDGVENTLNLDSSRNNCYENLDHSTKNTDEEEEVCKQDEVHSSNQSKDKLFNLKPNGDTTTNKLDIYKTGKETMNESSDDIETKCTKKPLKNLFECDNPSIDTTHHLNNQNDDKCSNEVISVKTEFITSGDQRFTSIIEEEESENNEIVCDFNYMHLNDEKLLNLRSVETNNPRSSDDIQQGFEIDTEDYIQTTAPLNLSKNKQGNEVCLFERLDTKDAVESYQKAVVVDADLKYLNENKSEDAKESILQDSPLPSPIPHSVEIVDSSLSRPILHLINVLDTPDELSNFTHNMENTKVETETIKKDLNEDFVDEIKTDSVLKNNNNYVDTSDSEASMPVLECMSDIYNDFKVVNKTPEYKSRVKSKKKPHVISRIRNRKQVLRRRFKRGKRRLIKIKFKRRKAASRNTVNKSESNNCEFKFDKHTGDNIEESYNDECTNEVFNKNKKLDELTETNTFEFDDASTCVNSYNDEIQIKEEQEESVNTQKVVYQVNENNVMLQIGDELLEINVTVQNGKKVILVKTFFSDAILTNHSNQETQQVCETVDAALESDISTVVFPNDQVDAEETGNLLEESEIAIGDDVCIFNEEIVSSSTEVEISLNNEQEVESIKSQKCLKDNQESFKCLADDLLNLAPSKDVLDKPPVKNAFKTSLKPMLTVRFADEEEVVDKPKVPSETFDVEKNYSSEKSLFRGQKKSDETSRKSSNLNKKDVEKKKSKTIDHHHRTKESQKQISKLDSSKRSYAKCKSEKIKKIKSGEHQKTSKSQQSKSVKNLKEDIKMNTEENVKSDCINLLKQEEKVAVQENQVSVQEHSITSSTSQESETPSKQNNLKLVRQITDEWDEEPNELKPSVKLKEPDKLNTLLENPQKRRLSLQEYNSRKHKNSMTEQESVCTKPLTQPDVVHENEERRELSPPSPILSINFSNKTYSRISNPVSVSKLSAITSNNSNSNFSLSNKQSNNNSDNYNKTNSLSDYKSEECLSSAIQLHLPTINRSSRPMYNQEYLKNALVNDLNTVNAYTATLIKQNQQLMHRFLEQKHLTPEELKKVKTIIRYKRLVHHLSTIKVNDELQSFREHLNKANQTKYSVDEKFKLPYQKVTDVPQRKKRKRFRFLYSGEDEEQQQSQNCLQPYCLGSVEMNSNSVHLCKKAHLQLEQSVPALESNVMDYSVHQSNSQGQLTLVFKRSFKSDPKMQPFVKLERLPSLDFLAKNRFY